MRWLFVLSYCQTLKSDLLPAGFLQSSVFNADDLETKQNIQYYFTFKTGSVGKESRCLPLSSETGISRRKIGESSRTPSSQFNPAASCALHHLLTTRSVIKMSHRQYFTASTCSTCFHVVCWHVHPAFPTYHWNAVCTECDVIRSSDFRGLSAKTPVRFLQEAASCSEGL